MLPERMPSDLLHEGEGLKRKGPRARCLRCSAQSGAALSFVAALVLLKQSASPLGIMTEVVGFVKPARVLFVQWILRVKVSPIRRARTCTSAQAA